MSGTDVKSIISEDILRHFLKQDALPDLDRELVVEAIDIGYGYTKYTRGFSESGDINCGIFPSLTPLSPQEDLMGEFFISRDTKKITSGGTVWEVGPGVEDIVSRNDVRALHDNYVNSEQWKVLLLGALAYMDTPKIDVLVLGLPVSNMHRKADVEGIVLGEHNVCGKSYTIKQVLVVPQPLGALYSHALSSKDFGRFASTNTLIVDPGYLTFDFLVTKGFSVNAHRSGARPGGMSAVLGAIANSIAGSIGSEYDDLNAIDLALDLRNYDGPRGSRPIFIYGQEIDLTPHIKQTKSIIDTSMNFMLNKIGDTKDISQIIMAGGPNKIFKLSVERHFARHQVIGLPSGITANVKGFKLWAMMVAYGQALRS